MATLRVARGMRAVLRRPLALVAPKSAGTPAILQVPKLYKRCLSSETPASVGKELHGHAGMTNMPKVVELVGASRKAGANKVYSLEAPRTFGEAPVTEWPGVYFELGKGKLSMLVTMTASAG
jgi:hypothetical protein